MTQDADDSGKDHGRSPQSAGADLRRILAASGGDTEILSQHVALRQWAAEQGRILDAATWVAPSRLGGLEHRIWYDGDRIIKITYGGSYGRIPRLTRDGLALLPAHPLAYLDRWARHNALFGELTSILGIVEARGGPQMVIAQPALPGPAPKQAAVIEWLRSLNYKAMPGMNHVYVSRAENIALFDARPANFLYVGEELVPFDLIPMPLHEVGL